MPRCGRERAKGLVVCSALPFPLQKPALPFFTQRMERKGQGDCAELCASPLQSLPETCWKTLRKRRLKATPAPAVGGCVGILSPQDSTSPSTQSPFSLQRAFVSLKGSKAMTNLTTIILQRTHRLFSSFLLQCFLTSVSVFSNTVSVLK